MSHFKFLLVNLALILLTTIAIPNAGLSKSTQDNIHKTGDCLSCHPTTNKQAIANQLKTTGYESFCKECHPRHKIEHTKQVGKLKFPSTFVLEQGKYIGCVTCHAEQDCKDNNKSGNSNLRGGPYQTPEAFCDACHSVNTMVNKVSPHPYKPSDKDSCFVCHTSADERAISKAKEHLLKQEPEKLCLDCHKTDYHQMTESHLGRRLDKGVKTTLPLNSKDQIYCATCHVPHLRKNLPGNTRKPAKGNKLCLECHKFTMGN